MNIAKRLIALGGLFLFVLSGSVATSAAPASAAVTSVTVGCASITCSVDSTIHGESNWASSGSSVGSSSGGSSGSSASDPHAWTTVTYTKLCDSWLPSGGGTSTGSYPLKSQNCFFSDSGTYSGSVGTTNFVCGPENNESALGRVSVYKVNPTTNAETYAYFFCIYPSPAYAPVEKLTGQGKVYTGGKASFYLANDPASASVYGTSGVLADSSGYVARPGVDLTNPSAYTGSWTLPFTAHTATNGPNSPRYGYYRLNQALDYRYCYEYNYPAWLNQKTRIDCSQQGTDYAASPYTYACNLNPALQKGIVAGAKFNPADCTANQWQCVVTPPIKINGVSQNLTVMRNGLQLTVSEPKVAVSGSAVKDAHSWQTLHTLTKNATPSTTFVDTSWVWGQWSTYASTQTMAFHWASDTASKPFSWSEQQRFTASFNVPTQASTASGTTYEWVLSAAACPQVTQSPKILVTRATEGS